MFIYQIQIEVMPFKPNEFLSSIRPISQRIRKQKDCLRYSLCRDEENENIYSLIGEWKTRQAMEKHFKTKEFELLIGAARVLGDKFEMDIAEVSKTGGIDLAREQIAS